MELRHTATRLGRLSSFLKNEMDMSTGLMNRLKWNNKILVNGKPEHNDFTVRPGDVIVALLDEEAPQFPAQKGKLSIIYEDEHILAVDKPAGILIHPSRATMTGTLANFVLGHYQATGQNSAFHPLTRLDRDTFGIVLIAKNSHIHALLSEKQKIQKTYHALVLGIPRDTRGTINAPIARRPLPSLLRYVHPSGKPSITEYRLLSSDGTCSLLELKPITCRTHQLRVHCAFKGVPILGDPQYGNERAQSFATHQQLCAKTLSFTHPITGEVMRLTSKLNVARKP